MNDTYYPAYATFNPETETDKQTIAADGSLVVINDRSKFKVATRESVAKAIVNQACVFMAGTPDRTETFALYVSDDKNGLANPATLT